MNNPIEVGEINGIQVVKAGKEGPNILLLHPAGQPPLEMGEHLQQLSEAGQVYAPNIYDLIASLRRRGNKNPSFADVVNEFSKLDLINKHAKTGLVAASFGGSFAWEYAFQNPKEVDFITAGSPTGIPLHRSLFWWVSEFLKEYVWEHTTQVPRDLRKKDPGPKSFIRQMLRNFPAVMHGLKLAMVDDAREKLSNIQQPVDLLWGRKDNYIPLHTGVDMQNLLPNARLEVVSEYNHNWFMYEPAKLTSPTVQKATAGR